jgi:predicted nucleic acid-binding protein
VRAIFIDTGAFLAKEIAADQFHRQAVEFWQQIAEEESPVLYSSEHVLDETATLLARRTSYNIYSILLTQTRHFPLYLN